jgi:predicted acyltransferase
MNPTSGAAANSSVSPPARITSIDALRAFVMFMMIFVNDLAGAPREIVPDWMVHFSDRHDHGSGMTFVDLVFPHFCSSSACPFLSLSVRG